MRYSENIKILKHLKDGTATAKMLERYSGWGGLRGAIYTPEIYKQLKQVLTTAEINSIKNTLTSAYYTPREIVTFIYKVLAKMGYSGGRVLEPAAGNGVFLKDLHLLKPQEVVAVELDSVSCKILERLYPNVKVINSAFEDTSLGKFDLIVGNPPYSKDCVVDSAAPDLNHLAIHHYFVAKCMRMLNNNGLLAMVLPSYFLDNLKDHARDIIAKDGGSLIAAFRLPDDLFADATVTIDIVFMVKGSTEVKWQKTEHIPVGEKTAAINEYFVSHADYILGELDMVVMYNRLGLTCKHTGNVFKTLPALLDSIKFNFSRSHAPIQEGNVHKLDASIAEIKRQIDALQNKLRNLVHAKERISKLQMQIDEELAKAVS